MNSKNKVELQRTSNKIGKQLSQSSSSFIGEDHHSYYLQEIGAKE
jgi:hypothetical protein